MTEVSQITVSKDGFPALHRAFALIRELCDGQVPSLMTSYTAKIERTKDGDPHPCMYVGYMPMVKIGGVSRPIIRFVSTNEIKFYDYDWHEITEEEYRKQLTAIPKANFNFVKSNVTYNEDTDSYTIDKRLKVSR
jgi:hypothetical protein